MTNGETAGTDGWQWNATEGGQDLTSQEPEAIHHLREAVRSGKDWHLALLEAVGMWTIPEEEHDERHYQYVVQGEAFDWLLLAERLCGAVDGLVPLEQKEELLFSGKLPETITPKDFQELIGFNKHRAYLNYWYGVVVEEALQLAVEEEVRKQHRARSFPDSEDLVEQAYVRLYEDTRMSLMKQFLKEKGIPPRASHSLTEMKEFSYWLFKRRLKIWDPARVASDTRKGINKLNSLRAPDPFIGS